MMLIYLVFFFFNDTATTEIYTLSLHDALPILDELRTGDGRPLPPHLKAVARRELEIIELLDRQIEAVKAERDALLAAAQRDRKSTRLNSSHANISYAVFCLKKKKKQYNDTT